MLRLLEKSGAMALLVFSLLLPGCGGGDDGPAVTSLAQAQALADTTARQWDANAKLVGATSVWVTEDGAVDTSEMADNPGYGFQYVSGVGTKMLGVKVATSGPVTTDGPYDLPFAVTKGIAARSEEEVENYIDAAQGELLKGPHASLVKEANVDIVVLLGFNQEDGSEDAAVMFFKETEKRTDWASFDWSKLFASSTAYVFMDANTLKIESNSWQMSFARALRLATAANTEYNRLVGIMAVWVNEASHLDEVTDNPGWGFQFVNDAGTKRVGITVTMDGKVNVFPPETLAVPQLKTLSPTLESKLAEYVVVAKAELAKAPAAKKPTTPTIDLMVMIGFSQADNTEDAIVMFFDEQNQGTNWATIDWFQMFGRAKAYVFMDAVTNMVENISWD